MRRFYQGILIRHNRTRFVTYGTITRLGSLTAAALVLSRGNPPGRVWFSIAFLGSGLRGGCDPYHGSRRAAAAQSGLRRGDAASLNYREITVFYTPLALTSLLFLSAHSIVTFFVARSQMAVESLAVLPVIGP